MVPVVVLIGRPNVGKSTLFNRLTCTSDALVADVPGLTRDRKYGRAVVEGRQFICIDTAGINSINIKNNFETKQSLLAIEEANLVLFIVDAIAGLMPVDSIIAKYLRSSKSEKKIFLVVNKTDGIDVNQAIADFWSLGLGNIYPIAASNGRGVKSLQDKLLFNFRDEKNKEQILKHKYRILPIIKLAIVGCPNVGKSTLINRLIGEDRLVVYDIPGTTRDRIEIPIERDGCKYVLIDTAGVRKRSKIINMVEKLSVIKTLQSIEDANLVVLVIDAHKGIADQDLSLLNFILNSGRSLVIVVNKWDSISKIVKKNVKDNIYYRLGFIDFVRVHFISALHGKGCGNIWYSIREAYNSATISVGASMLTCIMNMATEYHKPPLVRGSRVKLKYAHPGGYNPLIVVIHGNKVKYLQDSYKRYLMNFFRKSLNVIGTPILLKFKEGYNPYININ